MSDPENPYLREPSTTTRFEVPGGIELEDRNILGSFDVYAGDERLKRTFQIAVFHEGQDVPLSVAEWLVHRSFTDPRILADTPDDRYRFKDPQEVSERFLRDRGGRRLYVAVGANEEPQDYSDQAQDPDSSAEERSAAKLYGAAWLHPLELEDPMSADIVRACQRYNQTLDPHETTTDGLLLKPEGLSTLASRMYEGARGQKAHSPLVLNALKDYMGAWHDCQGAIVRVTSSNNRAVEAFTESQSLRKQAKFSVVGSEDGIMYFACRGFSDEAPQE